jgi:TolB-like protein/Tfp pilus assembly protein PilF
MPGNRKLAGILFADIQGFTAFMQEDEEKGMAILSKYQEVFSREAKKYDSEIIKNYGDGSICIFSSAADTVSCAIDIQMHLGLGKEVPLRIGLHLGDVIMKEGDIYGDALNIASRIESMAIPGAVLLSGSLHQKVINQKSFAFQYLGSYQLKNVKDKHEVYAISNPGFPIPKISEPTWFSKNRSILTGIMIFLALLITVTGFLYWNDLGIHPDRSDSGLIEGNEEINRSIAVLPFETIGAKETNNFTNGIHVDIITQLSKLSDIKLISRRSVMHYQGTQKRLHEIAEELGVKWLLTGEVQQAGGQVRMNASLVNAFEDRQQWSESYLRELNLKNYFAIQNEITEKIADELKTQLLFNAEENSNADLRGDMETYRLYVEGRALLKDRSRESMTNSVDYFQRVLDKDSTYALAWVGLAEAWTSLQAYGFYERDSLLPLAWNAIQNAIEIAPSLPEALAVKGLVHSDRYEGRKSIESLKRAAELRPTDSEIYNKMSWVQPLIGEPRKALANAKKSVSLNPLSHEAVSNLSLTYMFNGDFDKGLQEANTILQIEPDFPTGKLLKATALYHLGKYSDAEKLLMNLHIPWTGNGAESLLALTYLKLGNSSKAQTILNDLKKAGDHFSAGIILAAMQNVNASIEALELVEDWNFWPTQVIRYFYPDELATLRVQPEHETIIQEVDLHWNVE